MLIIQKAAEGKDSETAQSCSIFSFDFIYSIVHTVCIEINLRKTFFIVSFPMLKTMTIMGAC